MTNYEYTLLGMVVGLFVLSWLASKNIRYLKRKKTNTELWGTIFEGVTNKLINLDPIKNPEVFIEKKTKKTGQDYDELENQPDTGTATPKSESITRVKLDLF